MRKIIFIFFTFLSVNSFASIKEAKEAYLNHDYVKAFDEFLILAESGDAYSQVIIGDMYIIGSGVSVNAQEAIKWYKLAANSGDVAAQSKLARMYYFGEFVVKDKKEAFNWYYKAASMGSLMSQTQIGNMYNDGEGVDKNAQKSVYWFRLAANGGESIAQFNLGMKYCSKVNKYRAYSAICYALLSLSALDVHSDVSKPALDLYSKEMSLNEINEGKKLLIEMSKPNNLLNALNAFEKINGIKLDR